MSLTRTTLALLLAATLAAATAAAPAPRPLPPRELSLQRKNHEDFLRSLPMLDKHAVREVFQIQVEDGRLVLRSALPPTQGYERMRAELEGLAGPVVIERRRLSRDDPEQSQFELTLNDYSDPDAPAVHYLMSRPGHLRLRITRDKPGGVEQVALIQSPHQVRLVVSGRGDGEDLSLAARDFADLHRQNPDAVGRHVRPLLRALRQDGLFAPDPRIAWQVLADDWPAPEAVRRQVEQRLADLDSRDFRVRDRAVAALKALGRDAAAAIRRLDRSALSPEQNTRLDAVLASFQPLGAAECERLRGDVDFLLDCLACEDRVVRGLALKRLGDVTGRRVEFDVDAEPAERQAAVEALRDRLAKR